MTIFDHLVLAGPNLADLVELAESSTGVRSVPGGPHADMGTTNELLGLGPTSYLELIGPDPDQPEPAKPRPFGVDGLSEPRIMTWAIAVPDLAAAVQSVAAVGVDPGTEIPMARTRPDGVRLEWRLAVPPQESLAGIMPFLIEWGPDTPHPAASLDAILSISRFALRHPQPDPIAAAIMAVTGESVDVETGPALLSLTLQGPTGELVL